MSATYASMFVGKKKKKKKNPEKISARKKF